MTSRSKLIRGNPRQDLNSPSRLARNAFWNVLGLGAPFAVGVFCVPVLIHRLGPAKFGLLALSWSVAGYLSLFDLGLGRALTKFVAERLGADDERSVPRAVVTSLTLMAVLGLIASLVLALGAPLLVWKVLTIPVELRNEALHLFLFVSLCLPFIILTAGLRGVLEAFQRFPQTSVIRIAIGLGTFLAPMVVLPFTKSLPALFAPLLLVRISTFLVYARLCKRLLPVGAQAISADWSIGRHLIRLGGWMTLSNLISPLMFTMDGFFIAALLSVSEVPYYSTPMEIVTKLLIISSAIAGVIFPAFSHAAADTKKINDLYRAGLEAIVTTMLPITALVTIWSSEALTLWIGTGFAARSARVMDILCIGVFINSLASMPFALIQSMGRPDLTAKLHLLELPAYGAAVYWLTTKYGITGTAIAWTARITLDTLVLFVVAHRWTQVSLKRGHVLICIVLITYGIFGKQVPSSFAVRTLAVCLLLGLLLVPMWSRIKEARRLLWNAAP